MAAFATQFKPGHWTEHWCFLELASEKTWWTGHLNEPQGRWDSVANGWPFQVSHFPPDISSDRAIIAWTIEERRKRLPFPGYIRQQDDSHQDHIGNQFLAYLQSNTSVVWDSKSGTYTENSRRRRANRSGPWAAVIDHTKTAERCHKLEATRCYNSQKITRRWFGELPNRQHVAERWKMDNSTLPLNPSWMETALLFLCREYSGLQGLLESQDYKQFLTITSGTGQRHESKYSNLLELWSQKRKYCLDNQEIRGLGCENHEELNSTHDNTFILQKLNTKNPGAVFSPQSSSCGRAQTQGEHSLWTRSCAKAKAYTHWFQSTRLENNLSKSTAQKGLWIRQHLQALHENFTTRRFSWSWRSSTMDTCFDTHGRCWANSKLEQKRLDWRTQSFRRQLQIWSVVRTKTERVSVRVQYTAIVTGFKINPNLVSLKQIPLKLEGTHIPHGQLFQVQINPREWFVGRKIESKKHETSFFLLTSESARIVIETANDRVDRTRWWTKNGIVHDCIY